MILRTAKSNRFVMSKRALASPTASPTNKKKGKVTGHQYSLDRFFGGPSTSSPGPTPTPPDRPSKGKAKLTARTSQQGQLSNVDEGRPHPSGARGTSSIVQDSDATLAWSLAEEESLDLDKLRKLEAAAKRNLTRRSPSQAPVDIIDVDSLSDQEPSAGPSGPVIESSQSVDSNPLSPDEQPAVVSSAAKTPTPVLGGSHHASSADTVYERLDVDPASYVVLDNTWPPGRPVPYSFLAHTLVILSGTRSRIAILNTLTNCLRTITKHHPQSLLPALYLLSNSLSPPYSPLELGLGGSTISKAIQHVSGLTASALKRLYNTTGDPGKLPARRNMEV